MSPQSSPVRISPLEDLSEAGSLLFGETASWSLTMPIALVAKIWEQVEEGVRIVPRGGVEIGGLLVGPKLRESGVVVDGIIPLKIEYEYGPSFRMSASDLAQVAALVESVQIDPSKAVVGFYRSQTRGNETFRDSDREIFDAIEQTHAAFATDFRCYFVLASASESEMMACLSMWNGEEWDGEQFTLRSNPFSVVPLSSVTPQIGLPTELQTSRPLEANLVPAVSPTIPPLAEKAISLPEPRPRFRAVLNAVKGGGRPSKRLYVVLGLLVLVDAIGGYRWIIKNRAGPAQTIVPPMRFSVNREGPVWKLSWDRATIELMKPTGAVLVIQDGNRRKQLNLTTDDLSRGTILYTPRGGDLVFSLQLKRASATPIEERIRVLESGRSTQKPVGRSKQTLPHNAAGEKASSRGSTARAELPRATSSGTGSETLANPTLSPNATGVETKSGPRINSDVRGGLETPQSPPVANAAPPATRIEPRVDRGIPTPRTPVP